MAADRLADPTDMWRHDGIQLVELLGEDGAPDAERVTAAVAGVVEAHPPAPCGERPSDAIPSLALTG